MPIMLSEHVDLREVVAKTIYEHPAIGDRAIDFIHVNLAVTIEALRLNLDDVVTVNDWMWGGKRINSGLRDWHFPFGAPYSSHYYGNAFDALFKKHSAHQVYAHILANKDKYPFITRMEDVALTPTWNHIEVGYRRYGEIYIIRKG